MSGKLFKAANLLLVVFFSYAALMQLNDPDYLIWFPTYALCAMECLFLSIIAEGSTSPDRNWLNGTTPIRLLAYGGCCGIGLTYR